MKSDWIIHTVIDDQTGKCSGHTHGLNKFNSLEIEININLRPGVLGQYLNIIADHIVNKNLVIEDGERIVGLFDCPVYFFKTKSTQSEDQVLRGIFPDDSFGYMGYYPWDEYNDEHCKSGYIEQITFNTCKVWYVVVDFISTEEMKDKILSHKRGLLAVGYWIDKIEGLQLTTKPFKFMTSKGELFTKTPINCNNEHSHLLWLADTLEEQNRIRVFCKDATPEQIQELQSNLHLNNDEL